LTIKPVLHLYVKGITSRSKFFVRHSTTNRSGAKFKKMERAGLHVMFYYYSACFHLGKTKDERTLQYSRSNILGFINKEHFTSNNVPDGIKNATHNTFSNFRKAGY
jgi:hypothetical protein